MSDHETTTEPPVDALDEGAEVIPLFDDLEPEPKRKVRIRKLRLLALLTCLGLLAAVSTVFGMMMAVASDLPRLDVDPAFQTNEQNSRLVDRNGRSLGLLTGNTKRIIGDRSRRARGRGAPWAARRR